MPIIHKDVDSTLMNLGLKTEAFFHEANKRMGPYLTEAGKKAEVLWAEIQRRNDLVSFSTRVMYDPASKVNVYLELELYFVQY